MKHNRNRLGAVVALVALALLLGPSSVFAQEDGQEYVPDDVSSSEIRPEGWDYTLTIGGTVNLTTNNDNVIGQQPGQTWTISANIKAAADYAKGNHESRNTLIINETFTRTPLLSEFVRTVDEFSYESIYYYHFSSVPWFGPFVRFKLETSLFSGFDVQPEDTTYRIANIDGTVRDATNTNRLKLTDPLQPLTLKESAGFFARPISRKFLDIEFRLGAGARQVFADGLLVLADDPDTEGIIEIEEKESFNQAGLEAMFIAQGSVVGKRVTYSLSAETLTPFIDSSSDEDNLSAVDSTIIEIVGKVSFKLVDWASLDYQLKALRQPQLQEDPKVFQVQNVLLLTFNYTLLESEVAKGASEE